LPCCGSALPSSGRKIAASGQVRLVGRGARSAPRVAATHNHIHPCGCRGAQRVELPKRGYRRKAARAPAGPVVEVGPGRSPRDCCSGRRSATAPTGVASRGPARPSPHPGRASSNSFRRSRSKRSARHRGRACRFPQDLERRSARTVGQGCPLPQRRRARVVRNQAGEPVFFSVGGAGLGCASGRGHLGRRAVIGPSTGGTRPAGPMHRATTSPALRRTTSTGRWHRRLDHTPCARRLGGGVSVACFAKG